MTPVDRLLEQEGGGMKRRRKRVLAAIGIAAVAALAAMALVVVPALATPASGEHPTVLAKAQFGEIKAKAVVGGWKAEIETEGASDLHIVKVTIDPGGTLGWHSHPGPRFLIVTSGTATNYMADDPTCIPQKIPTGSGLFEPAGEVHNLRNETDKPLEYFTVQLVAAGAQRRSDEPSPGNCPSRR
jgi:quercetin dioxygenase-like cupin family protein